MPALATAPEDLPPHEKRGKEANIPTWVAGTPWLQNITGIHLKRPSAVSRYACLILGNWTSEHKVRVTFIG